MNDHNLDDLIIDTIQPNQSKTKGFLTIVALFIVILIVGIILSKTYNNDSNDEPLAFEDSTMVAPELKLQKSKETSKPKEDSTLLTIIEEKQTPEVKAPEAIVEVEKIEIEKLEVKVPEIVTEPTVLVETPIKNKLTEESVTITEEYAQIPPKPVKTITPKVEKKKPVTKPIVKHTAPKTKTKKYYVQVGSYAQKPSPRFMSVLKNSGFKYHTSKADTKGNKKLLIGPYPSRVAVDRALKVVRDRINKSAFVVER